MSTKTKLVANASTDTQEVVQSTKGIEQNDFTSRLAETLRIDESSFFETIPTEKGTMEVSKKTYNFANPIGKRSQITVYDVSIIESLERIDKALKGKDLLTYAICKEFSKIDESNKLENMGFKSIAELGKAIYGLETSTVNHYARIGKNFLNDDYTVKAGLPNLSVSHMIELSSLVQDNDITPVIELYTNGTLIDGMSTKKIRETLNALKGKAIEQKDSKAEPKAEAENNNTGESVANANDVQELESNFDSQVVIGKIINACMYIDDLFHLLNQHEINAIGYGESIDTIKALAKALL